MKKLFLPVLLIMLFTAFKAVKDETQTITGMVTDLASGEAIPHASIFVVATPQSKPVPAGQADANGTYRISVLKGNSELLFAAVAYENIVVKINGRRVINVKMKEVPNRLDEIVVRGYSKHAKQPSTASSYIVSDRLAQNVPIANVEQLVQGKVSGLNIQNSPQPNAESYASITENAFKTALTHPLSTFSIDVDAAAYGNVRRFINNGNLPPADAVRIEEMINYFDYDYAQPKGNDPININTEISSAPWNTSHKLVKIGLQGRKITTENLPASNLVFLIDVSGSMNQDNKLPLLVSSFKLLADQLRPDDKVAIVVYAGSAGLVLPSTPGDHKTKIKEALSQLSAGGSTAGGQGIELAYQVATQNFIKDGNNRVILATDGDFNVGASSDQDMQKLIENKRKSGVFLTVLGYGMGNYKDSKMETLANKGNGNYAYIDNISEARKVLINEFGGTLFTIAKDVKLQVEFNPAKVQAYRLIGYENRMLKARDFNDDLKDAGEMGAGHTVTALYEVIPAGVKSTFAGSVDDLKYQAQQKPKAAQGNSTEMLTVKLRYKKPDGNVSKLIAHPVTETSLPFTNTSENFRFSAAVAEFGMLLRQSQFKQHASFDQVIKNAQ